MQNLQKIFNIKSKIYITLPSYASFAYYADVPHTSVRMIGDHSLNVCFPNSGKSTPGGSASDDDVLLLRESRMISFFLVCVHVPVCGGKDINYTQEKTSLR